MLIVKKPLLFIPIFAVLVFTQVGIASPKAPLTYDNIHELYTYYHAQAPQSCEAIYYGLFTDGVNKKDYFETPWGKDWVRESWPDSYDHFARENSGNNLEKKIQERKESYSSLFGEAQEFFKNVVLNQESFQGNNDVVQEWSQRHARAELQILGSDIKSLDAYMDVYNTVDRVALASNLESEDLFYNKIFVYTESMGPPILGWPHNLFFGLSSPAAIMFRMGHELSHLIDWAPEPLIDILKHKRSYGARKAKLDRFGHFHFEDMVEEVDKVILREADRNGIEDLPKGGIDNGRGTELYDYFKKILEDLEFKKALHHFLKLEKSNHLPEQMTEAVADAFATLLVSDFIEKKYKTASERREAALSVLFSWSPHLFSQEAQKIMNGVSSKKQNEERVFRIILAHKKFRDFLGCEFYNENVPVDFSIVNKPIRIGDPNGDGKIDDADYDLMFAFHWRYADLFLEEAISLDIDKDRDIDLDDAQALIGLISKKSAPTEEISRADKIALFGRVPTKYKRQSIIVHGSTYKALDAAISEAENFYTSHKVSYATITRDLADFAYLVRNAQYAVEGASHVVYTEAFSEDTPEKYKKYQQVYEISTEAYEALLSRLRSLNEKVQK